MILQHDRRGFDMDYARASALMWTKDAIYELAGKLSKAIGYVPGADLVSIVHKLGGKIEYQDVFEAESTNDGSIQIDTSTDFRIFLPDYVSDERNRFTIAHEIGHYFLHYKILMNGVGRMQAARLSKSGVDRAEWEANWFAAGFLMPKEEFVTKANEFKGDEVALARYFHVSVASVRIQLKFYEKSTFKSR